MAEELNPRVTLEERFVELQNAKAKKTPKLNPKNTKGSKSSPKQKRFCQADVGSRLHYIESTEHTSQILHERIADNIEELKGLFAEDVLTNNEWFSNNADEGFHNLEEKLSWLLFVDGCSLLHILEKAKLDKPDQLNVKVDQLVLVIQDVFLLENQLPYLVLKMLWRDDNNDSMIETMKNFLRCHHWTRNNYHLWHQHRWYDSPTHLLDLQRNIFVLSPRLKEVPYAYHVPMEEQNNENNSRKKSSDVMVTFRNIQELRATGIRLKSSKTRKSRDISFFHGWLVAKLTLPEIVVDDSTTATFLNLIAYEMCPDFEKDYGICSFAAFMDSLIDHPEDVKALRSAGILLNSLGSDEEVANLFNILSSNLVPDTQAYSEVRAQIEKYYKNKWKTWIALGCHTYFSNPWAIIAFLAALLALVLTFLQTWFAIHLVG